MDKVPSWIDEQNERLGVAKTAKAWCPVCGKVYLTYGRIGQDQPLGLEMSMEKIRSTCGAPECREAEIDRIMRPKVQAAMGRYEDARGRLKQEEADAQAKKGMNKLKKAGAP